MILKVSRYPLDILTRSNWSGFFVAYKPLSLYDYEYIECLYKWLRDKIR